MCKRVLAAQHDRHMATCRVCEEMLRTHLYPPTSESLALMCGPPGMQDCTMVHLEKWGYKKPDVIIF